MTEQPSFAVIGGSGLYEMPGLQEQREIDLDTPFGRPSAPIVLGLLAGQWVAFLARHGIGHHIMPTEVNYRANIFALKSLGVERIVSISACGSLREDFTPGEIVIPDQVFDFTKKRANTFFGDGLVAHISVADPLCSDFSQRVYAAVKATDIKAHLGGGLITIEGPRFSTRAESNVFRSWSLSLIGMTASPECFLAREAEMCYAVMAHVTDYDVWHVSEAPVTVERVVEVLNHNTQTAQEAVTHLAANWNPERTCACGSALKDALITNPQRIPTETREKLSLLVGKYLK